MNAKAEEMLKNAIKMPATDRAFIAERLIRSLDEHVDPDVDAAWEAEIGRRLDEIRSGKVKCIPWEVVRDRIKSRLRNPHPVKR